MSIPPHFGLLSAAACVSSCLGCRHNGYLLEQSSEVGGSREDSRLIICLLLIFYPAIIRKTANRNILLIL